MASTPNKDFQIETPVAGPGPDQNVTGAPGSLAGWGMPVIAAVCERCDWRFLLPADCGPLALGRCPHCFQGPLSQVEASAENLIADRPPELVAPFSLSETGLEAAITGFAEGIPYAPEDLTPAHLRDRLRRILLPVWLVDAVVHAEWQVESGKYYEVVSHQDKYVGGNWVSNEVKERRIRWEPRLGRLARKYPNIAAPALEAQQEIRLQLGDYDFSQSVAYQPKDIQEAYVRLPDRSVDDAWADALATVKAVAAEECRGAAGADQIRQFSWRAEFPDRNWTLLLLPVLTAWYLDDEGRHQPVWINAQGGKISGMRRASQKRATRSSLTLLGVAGLIFLISLALMVAGVVVPLLLAVAILGLAVSLAFGMGAIVPVVQVWWFNRNAS